MYALAAHLGTLIAVIYFEKKNSLPCNKEVFLQKES